MKGYKVFNSDWTCRGYQYEVGKTYEMAESPKCYEMGFHYSNSFPYTKKSAVTTTLFIFNIYTYIVQVIFYIIAISTIITATAIGKINTTKYIILPMSELIMLLG